MSLSDDENLDVRSESDYSQRKDNIKYASADK